MNYDFNFSTRVFPSLAGDGETAIPADCIAAVFEPASPLPPEMIAPAWPMRRPGGAVTPAINPTIGFFRPRLASSLRNCAASSSAEPPISPIITIDLVVSSARNISSTSMNSVPLTRLAADADRGGLAEALLGRLKHRFIGQRARARDDADRARLENVGRHDA